MKTKILLGIICLGFMGFFSCNKEKGADGYAFKAVVIGENADCGVYAIRITSGQEGVRLIEGQAPGDTDIYIARNLPDELKINGLIISLNLRAPVNDEIGVCTDMGPSYPWVFVTKAKKE
jgi:hypothetical protein